MTQEEKAKRYDESIERARAFNNGEYFNIKAGTTLCEYIFPELKESEDEKIRKELIDFIKSRLAGFPKCDRFITWLEKQGEQKSNPCEKCDHFMLNCHNFPCSEKKTFDQGKSALEAIQEEKVDNANKIEPKFKDGDWITNGEYTYKVISVDYLDYTLQNQWGECVEDTIDYVNKAFHLWTIQDAKGGDVLAINWHEDDDSWEKIIIFKKYHNNGVEGLITSPCVEGYGNTFKNGKLTFHEEVPYFSKTWTANLHPATKEQCDLLFIKIKKAGYKWDINKNYRRK